MIDKAYFELDATFTAVETGLVRVLAPLTGNLVRAFVYSDTDLIGGDALFDVNKNGDSIWDEDPSERLKITESNATGNKAGLEVPVTQYTDTITVDFDGFTDDATSVGGNLIIVLEFEASGGGGGGDGSDAGCLLVLTDLQSISASPFPITIVFDDDTVVRDDGGYYSADDDTIKIPEGKAGWYIVTGQVRWQGSTSGDRYIELEYNLEGATMFAKHRAGPLAIDDPQEMQVTGLFYFEENTIITLSVGQDSGGSLNVQSPSGETWLAIVPAGKI